MTENTVCVTTKTVQKAIERYVAERCVEHFTTADIARFMGVEEYPVRAAVSWLARYELIEIVPGVRREPLRAMLDDLDYGFAECEREGFGAHPDYRWPSAFVDMFCATHKGCTPDTLVTRIEFAYHQDA